MKRTKILASLLLIAILFSFVPPIISNAQDQTSIEIVNHAGEGESILVEEGDTFIIDVNFKNPTAGIRSLTGLLEFDDSKLEIVNKVASDETSYAISDIGEGSDVIARTISFVAWDEVEQPDTIAFAFYNEPARGDLKEGLAFQVQFRVKEGATGSFDISLKNVEYADDINNEDYQLYPITTGNKITGKVREPLESIALNKTATTLEAGKSETLKVTYSPETTTDAKEITWSSSNENIAKVDQNGKVTAVAPGTAGETATITATSSISGVAPATCKVTVTSKLQSISINQSTLEMGKGQTETLSVIYMPANTTDSKEVTWDSTNKEVATVDQNGKVTAVGNGTTTITATSSVSGVAPASCTVTVTSKLQYIYFDETEMTINKGETKELVVKYMPEDTTDSKDLTWTSDRPNIVEVDNGRVEAKAVGTANITANCNGKTATITVEVKNPLTGIEIIGGDIEVLPGQKPTLEVSYDQEDTTDSKTIIWSTSAPDIVSISATGKIEALKPGTAEITATCGNIVDTIVVTVLEVPAEKIAFESEKINLNKNGTAETKIIFYPENTTDSKTVEYTSLDPEIADVDENGVITAKSAGTTTITAKAGDLTAECEVTVKVPLTGISLNNSKIELVKGKTEQLNVIFNEEDTTDDKTITWTSLNENVATVDENGNITARGSGTATIQAQVGNYIVLCEVTVKVPLTGISMKESTTLIKNQTETLVVNYNEPDTTDDKTITWKSEDPTIATVDENGKVTAIKEGKTTVTAKVGDFEAECIVIVEEIKLEGIAISNKIDTLLKGQETKLEIVYTPENTTDSKDVKWTSSDEAILSVDEEGNVKALKAGKATITAVSGDFTDSLEITVREIPITGMEIKAEKNTLKIGEKLLLNMVFTPENTTMSKEVTYIVSDDAILSVDEEGKVTALKPGKAVVTAVSENGIFAQIELTVENEEISQEENNNNNNNGNQEETKNEESESSSTSQKSENTQKVESPKTGDINIALYGILMIVSLIGILKFRKK